MKEKEIDAYLALAAFMQLLVLAFGGAFAAEVVDEHPREVVVFFGSLLTLVTGIACFYFYIEAFSIIKRKH